MTGTTDSFESELLRHLLLNEAVINIGDSAGLESSSVNGNVYICLLKADPGEEGSIDNEADYTGYSRVAIDRGDAGWIEANGRAYNKEVISFPVCTGGANDIKWFGVCKTSTGDDMMWYGELSSTLYISAGVRPQYNIGQLAISIN